MTDLETTLIGLLVLSLLLQSLPITSLILMVNYAWNEPGRNWDYFIGAGIFVLILSISSIIIYFILIPVACKSSSNGPQVPSSYTKCFRITLYMVLFFQFAIVFLLSAYLVGSIHVIDGARYKN